MCDLCLHGCREYECGTDAFLMALAPGLSLLGLSGLLASVDPEDADDYVHNMLAKAFSGPVLYACGVGGIFIFGVCEWLFRCAERESKSKND